MTDVIRTEQEIFDLASQMESPEPRTSYIKQACGGDSELESRLFALLSIHDSEDDLLDHSPEGLETVDVPPDERLIGDLIGSYKPLQKIGEGGFGVVYMAEQVEPVRRKVALKIIKPGMDSREVVARFESERQALAMMNHPNIANVLDGGRTSEGRPYFVMELVRGVSLTEYCDKKRLSIRERIGLFMDVCRAVQHAHQKGIIHRDIKPSNVMVTMHDGTPIVKVIDFGVAKAINQQLTEKTLFTRYGQMVGTPQYMSPEQAEMSGLDVDTRSDIYSLGVLLYELLVGTTPLTEEKFRRVGYVEMQRLICEEELARPSNRLSTTAQKGLVDIAEHRGLSPKILTSEIRGDLEWIVMQTLEKERERRYGTPIELCQDLERYLLNEPVNARPPSFHYRVSKYLRRNRAVVATVATLIAVLAFAATFSTGMWLRAAHATATAKFERDLADIARDDATKSRDDALALAAKVQEQATQLEGRVYDSLIGEAAELRRNREYEEARSKLDRCAAHLRDWEWDRLRALLDGSQSVSVTGSEIPLFTKTGDSFITNGGGDAPNFIRSWDTKSGTLLDEFEIPTESYLCMNALHPDESLVAASDAAGNLFMVNPLMRDIVHRIPHAHEGRIDGLCFSPDGTQFISTGWGGFLKIWDTETGNNIKSAQVTDQLRGAEIDPKGHYLATACLMGTGKPARIWDAHNLTILHELMPFGESAFTVAFSRNGDYFVAAGREGAVEIWRTDTWETVSEFSLGSDNIRSVRFTPDGTSVAAALKNNVRFASVNDGSVIRELTTELDTIYQMNFCPGDRTFAVFGKMVGKDVTQLHDLSLPEMDSFTKLEEKVGERLAAGKFSIDGRHFAAGGDKGIISVWDNSSMKLVHSLQKDESPVGCVRWASDNKLFSYHHNGTVAAWDVFREEERWSAKVPGQMPNVHRWNSMVISPDGKQLFVGDPKGMIWILDAADGNISDSLQVAGGSNITSLAISHDGSRLAVGNYSPKVVLFDLSTREQCGTLPLRELAKAIAFSPDSKRCAIAEYSHRVSVFDTDSHRRIFRSPIGASGLSSIAFSQSGRRLFVLSKNRVHVMDAGEGYDLFDWSTPTSFSMDVCQANRAVATVGESGEVRIYQPTLYHQR